MTARKHLKQRISARMERTGESYADVHRQIIRSVELLAVLVLLTSTLGLSAAQPLAATINTIVQVKDINLKSASSNPNWLTNVNGTLFFAAFDASSGIELWKSNGSAASTVLIKDIYPGSLGAN